MSYRMKHIINVLVEFEYDVPEYDQLTSGTTFNDNTYKAYIARRLDEVIRGEKYNRIEMITDGVDVSTNPILRVILPKKEK